MIKILVTGASGFIGSTFIRYILRNFDKDVFIRALVKTENQKNLRRLYDHQFIKIAELHGKLQIINGDLLKDLSNICEDIDWVVHFAAKTSADYSTKDALPFIESNVLGTYKLLEDARKNHVKRYIQVSTDEVYGSCFDVNPDNPYLASKIGADALVASYFNTHQLHTTVVRAAKNYGPWQGLKNVLPDLIKTIISGQSPSIHGNDYNLLWVEDCITGILTLLQKEDLTPGRTHHMSGHEITDFDFVEKVLRYCGKENKIIQSPKPLVKKEHKTDFDWTPRMSLNVGLAETVSWYLDNQWWLN